MIPDKWKSFLRELVGAGPVVRPMTKDDVERVVRVIRLHDTDDAKAAQYYFDAPERFQADYEDACHFVIIDPESDRIVGVCGYGRDPSPEAPSVFWLGWTYVNPYAQGKGFGQRLFHVVVEHVRRLGGRKLFVATSSLPAFEKAVTFYQRVGFREEGRLRDYYGDGEHKIIMGLRI